ncbi:hypothetical protein DFS33DRAFT_1398006, partial [Desarmillaria ectypa]
MNSGPSDMQAREAKPLSQLEHSPSQALTHPILPMNTENFLSPNTESISIKMNEVGDYGNEGVNGVEEAGSPRPGHDRVTSKEVAPSQYSDTLDASSFWAVIIGIDAYTSSPLRSCVADALLMSEYLVQDLGVPKQHIQHLFSAVHVHLDSLLLTRDNIIHTLQSGQQS